MVLNNNDLYTKIVQFCPKENCSLNENDLRIYTFECNIQIDP